MTGICWYPGDWRGGGAADRIWSAAVCMLARERELVRFWFEDESGLRPLEEIGEPALRKAVSDVRMFVESAIVELLQEELAVIFWENEAGALKMTLRGPDDVVKKAKSLIGERAAISPTKH